ncbi:MAG: DUF4340 domain-containing protein [Bacteroidetes bacterium]|nr:DUF4340 domain-containing protein [Bacteroidota bacterium]MCL1967987.1 DUF4340 domain-containing protein [Bacteroidota bacterium]
MKRQKVYLVLASLLAIISILVIVYKRGYLNTSMSYNKLSTVFAIKDTATVTKIFMADMTGARVLLTKTSGGWMVDNEKPAAMYKIKDLLMTMNAIRVAQPLAKNAQNSIIGLLAVSSTKVEIYEIQPLFTLFGHPFFVKERLSKTYFLGDATQNNMGSFASLEGMAEPYIIYKPGFRGFVTPQFSPKPIDWYSPLVFTTKLTQIQNASFIDVENPENSFYVNKSGTRTFTLLDSYKNEIRNYDTTLLVNMLSEFRERYYEQFLQDMTQHKKDSIVHSQFTKTISVTDVDNKTTTLCLYYIVEKGDLYEDDQLIETDYDDISLDRYYAIINGNKDEIYTVQFVQYLRQLQPLSYYLKK